MIRLDLKIKEEFMRLVFQDRFWVVDIPFVRVVRILLLLLLVVVVVVFVVVIILSLCEFFPSVIIYLLKSNIYKINWNMQQETSSSM